MDFLQVDKTKSISTLLKPKEKIYLQITFFINKWSLALKITEDKTTIKSILQEIPNKMCLSNKQLTLTISTILQEYPSHLDLIEWSLPTQFNLSLHRIALLEESWWANVLIVASDKQVNGLTFFLTIHLWSLSFNIYNVLTTLPVGIARSWADQRAWMKRFMLQWGENVDFSNKIIFFSLRKAILWNK